MGKVAHRWPWFVAAALAVGALVGLRLLVQRAEWPTVRLGSLGRTGLTATMRRSGNNSSRVARDRTRYILGQMSLVRITSMPAAGPLVLWFPDEQSVSVTRLSLGDNGPTPGPPATSFGDVALFGGGGNIQYMLQDRLALATGLDADGRTVVACVQPYDWQVVLWCPVGGDGAPRSSRYPLPWDRASVTNSNMPRGADGCAVALGPQGRKVYVALSEWRKRTHFAMLDTGTGTWQNLADGPAMWWPSLLVLPDGSWLGCGGGTGGVVGVTGDGTATIAAGPAAMGMVSLAAGGGVHLFCLASSPTELVHLFRPAGQDGWTREVVETFGMSFSESLGRRVGATVGLPVGPPMAGLGLAYPSACVDADGRVHVVYQDLSAGGLKHAWKEGGAWHTESVGHRAAAGGTSVLVRDGLVLVAYADPSTGEARLAWRRPAPAPAAGQP